MNGAGGSETRFTLTNLVAANIRLRNTVGKEASTFGAAQFVGMIGDEIEALRGAGHDWSKIAALVRDATGKPIDADVIRNNHKSDPRERLR